MSAHFFLRFLTYRRDQPVHGLNRLDVGALLPTSAKRTLRAENPCLNRLDVGALLPTLNVWHSQEGYTRSQSPGCRRTSSYLVCSVRLTESSSSQSPGCRRTSSYSHIEECEECAAIRLNRLDVGALLPTGSTAVYVGWKSVSQSPGCRRTSSYVTVNSATSITAASQSPGCRRTSSYQPMDEWMVMAMKVSIAWMSAHFFLRRSFERKMAGRKISGLNRLDVGALLPTRTGTRWTRRI